MRSLLLFAGLTLLWMGVIFWFSANNSTDSAALSGELLKKLLAVLVPRWKQMDAAERTRLLTKLHHGFRKLGHFTEYGVLGMLLTATVHRLFIQNSRLTLPKAEIWLPALLALCYAATDEYHQTFVSGRSGELRDVAIDFSGACCGIAAVFLGRRLARYIKRRAKRKA